MPEHKYRYTMYRYAINMLLFDALEQAVQTMISYLVCVCFQHIID